MSFLIGLRPFDKSTLGHPPHLAKVPVYDLCIHDLDRLFADLIVACRFNPRFFMCKCRPQVVAVLSDDNPVCEGWFTDKQLRAAATLGSHTNQPVESGPVETHSFTLPGDMPDGPFIMA